MDRMKTAGWWYWLLTVGCLMWELAQPGSGAYAAIALCVMQTLHFAARERRLSAFPVQVRCAYLLLLLMALWQPLRFIYGIQLIGTLAMVSVNYCFLARCLSLLPWNRTTPLTRDTLTSTLVDTFFSAPVSGSVAQRH